MSNFDYQNDDFEALLNEYMPVNEELKPRKKVTGTIASMDRTFAYLEAGEPMTVRVKSDELRNYNEGDTVEVFIVGEDMDEEILIGSRKRVEAEEGFEKLKTALENKTIVTGKITKKINGGYIVEVYHQDGFLPNSLSEIPLKEGENFVGTEVEVLVKEIKDKKKILFSRRDVVNMREMAELETLKLGDVVEAVVTEILDFGLVTKIGNLKGFVHISEVSWKKTENLKSMFKVGEVIKGEIIEIDPKRRNIKLSMKALVRNPWDIASETFAIGDEIPGKVTKLVQYGAFIELLDGVEGLIHISDFAWNKKKVNMNEYVKVGDEVTVKITEFEPNERKLKLGIKQLSKNPWDDANDRYSIGTVLTGKVVETKPFGIFVKVEEGVDVFIHNSDFAWTGNKKYKIGDEVEFKVIELNLDEQKLKGSIKDLTRSPWELAAEKYSVGDVVTKEIKNIQDFGLFIKLEPGVDGFIPSQMASREIIKNLQDKFTPGDMIEAEIIEIDSKKERIKLSAKKLQFDKEKQEQAELLAKYGVSSSEK
ncbi:small subunit ribosomal protein S1 [Cetobacterium ceti]|uniref:Small subunit ribosomal protein S1 n=1 Tax=Cetobacterium ceti TaxID=180163 RepID=A0A1T4NZF6_9FUSO|nr:30S ribosomal protein S1 [Cetobacterium ceti]SJZ84467.1 small subunit ribosomal protein S1 [Cetobacterium ceti]